MLKYEGLFFDDEMTDLIHLLEEKRLPSVNDILHCTFKYHPSDDEIFNDLVGKTFTVYLVGYGNDGQNSGFELILPDELKKYYINCDGQDSKVLTKPHITASLAEDAKAVNTKNLNFIPLENKVKLTGRFGYWIENETEEYVSYSPYPVKKKKLH